MKVNFKKKSISLLVFTMILSLLCTSFHSTNVYAVEKSNASIVNATSATHISTEDELKNALKNGGQYILTQDLAIESNQLNVTGNITLDLGGKTLSTKREGLFVIKPTGNLVIGNGNVQSPNANAMFDVNNQGQLTIENGDYTAKSVITSQGKVVLNDGNLIGDMNSNSYILRFEQGSETYLYGGTISNCNKGIGVMNSTIPTVKTSSHLSKTTLGNYSDDAYMLTDEEYNNPIKLVFGKKGEKGPKLLSKYAGIYGNFWNSETDITINSGSIISEDTAIYHPQQGKFTMNGGYLQGATAIEAKMGDFTFNGGYVIGNGEVNADQEYEDILGGTTDNGAAMKFELYYYGARDTDDEIGARGSANQQANPGTNAHLPKDNDFSLTINDGVFISKNNSPITVTNWNMCAQKVNYNVKHGRFSYFPKTIEKRHGEKDVTTAYGIPVCGTIDTVNNYLGIGNYKFAPSAYYDGVDLAYGFKGEDAAYYASTADAIADRDNDKDARAYIYYLLNNGLAQNGKVDRQTQIFYNLDDYCLKYIPESLGMGTEKNVFGYDFNPDKVSFNPKQYVLTHEKDGYALWAPAVTYDANGGAFEDNLTQKTVLATTASGLFTGKGYGYVVDDSKDKTYVTLDEKGTMINTPKDVLLINPNDPTWKDKIFIGWFYDNGKEFNPEITQIKENLTVYAKWKTITPSTPDVKPSVTPPKQDTNTTTKPTTGDNSQIMLWVSILAISGVVLVITKKNKKIQ